MLMKIANKESKFTSILFFIAILSLMQVIRCEDDSLTSNKTSIDILDSAQQFLNLPKSVAQQQLPPNCFEACEPLEWYNCSVCYKQCDYSNGSSTFQMKTCESKFCSWWDIFPYSEDNPTSTYTRCTQWEVTLLPQQQCIPTCCMNPDYQVFTAETWQTCLSTNVQAVDEQSTTITIVAASLSGLFIFIIFLVIFCWCRQGVRVCFNNFIQFFKNLFPCFRQEKKRNSQTADTADTAKQMNKIQRSRRKWQMIKRKKQGSQLATSKYIIESQYDINPQIYCSICLQDNLNCQTECGHRFHFQCLRQSLMKKTKCSDCSGKRFNPLKIICESCNQKYTLYEVTKKNIETKYPDFYEEGKIYCDECHSHRSSRK